MTPEERAARLKALDEADAKDKGDRLAAIEEADTRERRGTDDRLAALAVEDYNDAPWYSKAMTTADDLVRSAGHGMTFGLSDKVSAGMNTLAGNVGSTLGISEDVDYQDALDAEKRYNTEAEARLNNVLPGLGTGAEIGGSLMTPGGWLKAGAAKVAPGMMKYGGKIASGVADVAENAIFGATSAYGHDQDPLAGAMAGAGGSALAPLGQMGGKMAPRSLGLGGAYLGSKMGAGIIPEFGAWGGGALGYGAGHGAGKAVQKLAQSPTGRDILAKISSAPGRLYGWAMSEGE